jgi:single-strand DNA-binding protein
MYNRVILMGRLVADPELRQTQSGIAMCRLRIAVDRGFAKQGEERQSDFINVTCWRQTAEFVSRYFSKGRMIHVEGRLQNNDYTDQNGVKHYSMDVVADNVTFCGDKRQDNGGGYSAPNQYNNQYNNQYGGNAPQYGNPPQQQYQQQYGQPAPAPQAAVNRAPQPIELGNLEDFEEVLSDGEVPF